LGVGAIGYWQRGNLKEPEGRQKTASPDAEEFSAVPLSPDLAVPRTEADLPAIVDVRSTQPQRALRVTLSSGMGLAMVLTINAVLSDPLAGFDYLAARLDPYTTRWPKRRWNTRRASS
jgi:hypothetical protein